MKIVEFCILNFFLPQAAQFDKFINIFCLVFGTLRFSFAVYFLQLTQYVSIVFIQYIPQKFQDFLFLFLFHYIILKHY